MKICIINNETHDISEIIAMLNEHTLKIFRYDEDYDTDCDLFILTWWSNYSIFHSPNPYKKEISLIKKQNKPIIWICLGSQLIAKAFWSSFGKLSEKIRKVIKIRFVWLDKELRVYEAHRYYIRKLWVQIDGIAKSNYWREIIKHKKKNIWWLQFHPEVNIENNDWFNIFENTLNLIFNK